MILELHRGLTKKTRNKYTSPGIQNELLQIMALSVLREITAGVCKSAFFYAVMADGCADVSNSGQLALCFRWADETLQVQGYFVGLYKVQNRYLKL